VVVRNCMAELYPIRFRTLSILSFFRVMVKYCGKFAREIRSVLSEKTMLAAPELKLMCKVKGGVMKNMS